MLPFDALGEKLNHKKDGNFWPSRPIRDLYL